jgi:hypothetical protein
MADSIPGWALETAHIKASDVLAWVAGKTSAEWFPPVFMLTEKEILKVDKGFLSKTQHRIPRSSIRSVSYKQGMMTDVLFVNVAGGDIPDSGIRLSKNHRERAHLMLELLRQQLTAP